MMFSHLLHIIETEKDRKETVHTLKGVIAMKNLLPITAGVVLCLICTVVGILIPQFSALAYVTVTLACVTGLLCIGGIFHHITRGSYV